MVEFEESEAQLRSAEKDAVLFKKICQDLRQLFADIAELKVKATEEVKKIKDNITVYIITIYSTISIFFLGKRKNKSKENRGIIASCSIEKT